MAHFIDQKLLYTEERHLSFDEPEKPPFKLLKEDLRALVEAQREKKIMEACAGITGEYKLLKYQSLRQLALISLPTTIFKEI